MSDDLTTPAAPEAPRRPSAYSRKDAKRDIILGLVIITAVATAYFFGRHRRAHHLNDFAQCLAARQVKMYGAYWCPHCAEQKEIFGPSFEHVPYMECGVPGQRTAESPECVQLGIKRFPTWQFPNGARYEGVLQLKALSEKTGCTLP